MMDFERQARFIKRVAVIGLPAVVSVLLIVAFLLGRCTA